MTTNLFTNVKNLNRTFRRQVNSKSIVVPLSNGRKITYTQRRALRVSVWLSKFLMMISLPAFAIDPSALPKNGSVVGGTGSISTAGNQMQVTQNSQNMIVNWQSFNIGKDAGVNFAQPNSQSSALNRVMSADPSYIMGSLTSNGRVFLVNPSGVMFGNGAQVNVGSLVASTLDISNSNFMSGNYIFEKNGSAGSVVNQGNIRAANGGFVALLAPEAINQGLISARLGTVALAAGDKVSLDIKGDGLLSFKIDKAAVKALADNRGLIEADGGKVILGARSAGDLMATVVNNSGVIEANSVTERNGVIILDGGTEGIVINEGALVAKGNSPGQTGGTVKVLGDKVGVMAGAVIDASGQAGGGEVLIGGNFQGSGSEQNASITYVAKEALIKANAIDSGNGGKVIVWANDTTRFYGAIEAKGGANSGDGGFVETSGKNYLDYQGLVFTTAEQGKAGTLLLDPTNITIQNAGPTTTTLGGGTWYEAGTNATSVLTVGDLETSLASTSIIVTTASGGASAGTITVLNPVTWSSGNSLTLNANSNVSLFANITSTGSVGAPGLNGTKGGDFSIISGGAVSLTNSAITTTGGTGGTGANGGVGGNVSISAVGNLTTDNASVITATGGLAGPGGVNGNGGSVSINATGTVSIGSDITTSGRTGGNISISATNNLSGITIGAGKTLVSSGDGSAGGSNAGSITLSTGTGGTLTTGGAVSALGTGGGTSNTINITADSLTVNSTLDAETVNISTKTSTRDITLGSAGGGLLLTDTVANRIFANNLYVSTGSGNIDHQDDFSVDNFGGGVFSIVTNTGAITNSTPNYNLGPTSTNASNYILSGASIGTLANPMLIEHAPVLSLTSAGNIYVDGRGSAVGPFQNTTSLTVNSTSGGTGSFGITLNNAVPSITTAGNVYTLSGTNAGTGMSFSFTGNSDINVGTGAAGISSNGGAISVTATGVGSDISVVAGGAGVVTSGTGSITLNAGGALGISNTLTAGSGGIDLTGGSGISYTAGTVTAANGPITFNSATTLNNPLTLDAGSGTVTFSSTLNGNAKNLIIGDGFGDSGAVNFVGAITNIGSGTGAAITLNNSGLTTFQSTLAGNSGIVSTAGGGSTKFVNNVTLGNGDTGSSFAGSVNFDGLSWSSYDGLTVNGATTLSSGAVSLASNNSNINLVSTVDGAQALTLASGSGTVNIGGTIGGTTGLSSLSINSASGTGSITLADIGDNDTTGVTGATAVGNTNTTALTLGGALYKTGGAQTYTATAGQNIGITSGTDASFTTSTAAAGVSFATSNIALSNGANLSVVTNNGAISALKIDGTSSEDVTLNAGTSTVTVGAIGTQTANGINTVVLTGSGGVTLNGNITTDNTAGNSVTVIGPAILGGDVTVNTAANTTNNSGSIAFTSTINGDSYNLNLNSGLASTTVTGLASNLGTVTLQANTPNATGAVAFNGGLSALALTNFARPYSLTLNGAGTISTPTSLINTGGVILGGGQTFTGGLTSTSSANTILGNVSTTNTALTLGTTTIGGNATLASGSGAITLGATTIDDGNTLTIGNGTGSSNVTIASLTGVDGGATSNLTFNVLGTVDVQGAIGTDIGNLIVTNSAGTNFQGAVGTNIDPINNVALTATTGNIAFSGDLYATTLSAAGGNFGLAFNGSNTTVTNGVTLANTGTVTLGNANSDLLTFTGGLNRIAGATSLGGHLSSTNSGISLAAVTLGADSTITTANQTIGIGSVVGGNYSLALGSGTTATTVTGTISGVNELTLGSDGSSGSYALQGNVQASTLTSPAGTYTVSLTGGSVNISNNINFLTTNTVTLGDSGSDAQILGGGVTHTAGVTRLGGNLTTTDDAVNFGAVTLLANSSINTQATTLAGDITLGAVTGNTFNLGLSAGNVADAQVNVTSFNGGGNLTLTSADTATFGAVTAGVVTISDALTSVTFNGDLSATTLGVAAGTSAYNVALNGANTTVTNPVIFNNAGTLTLGNGGDTLTFNGGLVATAPFVHLGGNVLTSGDVITLGSSSRGITVDSSSMVDSTNLGLSATGANINLSGAIDGTVGGTGLTVRSGSAGNITISQNVGGTNPLLFLDLEGSSLNINATTITLSADDGFGPYDSTWTGSTVIGANGTAIIMGGNSLNLDGTVNADDAAAYDRTLTITSTGNVTLGGSVGTSQALADLDVTASQINLNGTSYQINDNNSPAATVTFTGATALAGGANVTINTDKTTGTDNALSFTSTIDGAQGLIATSGTGAVSVGGTIGGTTSLTLLTINAGGATGSGAVTLASIGDNDTTGVTGATAVGNTNTTALTLGGALYKTGGAQTYTATAGQNIGITSGTDASFTTSTAAAGVSFATSNIALSNGANLSVVTNNGAISALKIDGTSSEDVTLNAGTSTVTVGAIGTQTANGINTVVLTGSGGVTLNGNITTDNTAGNSVTVTGPTTLGANVAIDTSANTGGVSFVGAGSTIDGAQTLAITSGAGNVSMGGTIGGTTGLTALNINSASGAGTIALADIGDANTVGVTGATAVGNANTNQLNISGTTYKANQQTYTAAAGANKILLLGGGTVTFTSSDDAIAFNTADIGLFNSNLVVNSNGGAISALGMLGTGANDVTLNANGGATNTVSVGRIGTTPNPVNTIILTGSGGVTLNGDITTNNGAGNSVTVTGPTTLGANITIDTSGNTGGVTFSGATSTINGARTLAITAGAGNVALQGNVGAGTALTQLTASGNNIDLHDVKTTGIQTYTATGTITTNSSYISNGSAITFAGNTVLNDATTVDTTNGGATATGAAVSFNGTLNSQATEHNSLGITAGSAGDITFAGVVGGNDSLGAVTLTSAHNVTATTFNASSLTQSSGSGLTDLNGLVTTVGNVDLTGTAFNVDGGINAGGYVAFVNSGLLTTTSNITTGAQGFTQAGTGLNSIGGNITTADGNIAFATGVTLTTDVTLSSGAGAGNISFNSTLDGTTAGAEDLTLTAGTGNITFTGAVGGTTRLGVIDINSATNVTANAITAAALNQDAGTGTTTLNGAVDTNTAAGVTLSGTNLVVNAPITTTSNGVVTFNETGTIVIAAAGDITADGAVTMTATGGISTAGDVTTTNDNVTYVSATVLTGDIAINTGAGAGNISFNSTLDGTTAGAEDLTLTAGTGNITFTGAVGGTTRLGVIDINSATNVTANAITAAALNQDAGTGTTTLNGAVDTNTAAGVTLSGTNLVVNAPITTTSNGVVTFNETGTIVIAAAGDITADGAVTMTATGGISTAGDVTTTNDNVTYVSATVLTGDIAINTGAGAGNISFNSTLDGTTAGAEDLTLTAGTGNITFTGAVGGTTRLGVIDINSATNVTANAITAAALNQDAGTGTTTLNGAVDTNTAAGVTLSGTNLVVNAPITTTSNGVVTFNETGTIVIAAAGDITADGAVTMTATGGISTAGDVTTTNDNVTYVSATVLTGDIAINTGAGAGNISFNSTLDGTTAGAEDLTLTAGTGNITFTGAVGGTTKLGVLTIPSGGAVDVNANMTVLSLTSTSTTFDSAGVLINTSGDQGLDGGNISILTTGNLIAGDLSSNGGYETYIAPNTGPSAGSVTLNSANGNVRVATIEAKGANDITPVDIAGNGGAVSITAGPTSTITLLGDITTTGGLRAHGGGLDTDGNGGNVTLNSPVVLANNIAINASGGQGYGPAVVGGNIVFSSTVDGPKNLTLATNAGGNITMSGLAGNDTPLDAILINNAANVTTNGVRAASFTQTTGTGTTTINAGIFSGSLSEGLNVTGPVNVANNAIAVNGSITAGTTVDFNATVGALTIAAAGDITAGGAVNLTGATGIATAGDVTTSGGLVNYNSATTLTGPVAVDTTNGGGTTAGANIQFFSTVDGNQSLTLNAGTGGDITMSGLVGDATPLDVILINNAANVTTNGVRAASFTQTTGTGTTTINAGTFTDTLSEGINVTGLVNVANNAIAVNGGINAGTTVDFNATGGALTIAAAGDITAGGAVNLTGATGIATAGDVTTSGGVVNYNSATTLTGPVAVNAGAGNITFENTLNGAYALTLASSGAERFNGAVGSIDPLASIETDAPGSVVFNGGLVRTTGAQTYNDVATLGVDTTLEGTAITLASTVNGAQSLTINDLGQTTLSGRIGGVTPLVNLTVNTAGGLVLPQTTLSSNMSLTTDGAVTQVGTLYVGGTTHIDAGANPITLTNGANDFVGLVGSLDGTSVGVKGSVVSITDSNDIYLGQIGATAGAVTINAGGSIYNGLAGVTNITSTAASMLGGNGGVVGTLANPVTVNLPSVTANATRQQGGVSIDLSGYVGDNTIWLTQTPPGLVILNGMIINPGQVPGVPQNAYATALAVLDQTYLTGNGNVLNTKPYSTVGTLNSAMYPTDDNGKAFSYGPYIYKLPRNVKIKDGGIKLPAGLQVSMNK